MNILRLYDWGENTQWESLILKVSLQLANGNLKQHRKLPLESRKTPQPPTLLCWFVWNGSAQKTCPKMLWVWTQQIMYLWCLAGQCSIINEAFWKKSLGSLSGPVALLGWWTRVDQLLCKHSLLSSYLLKKLSNVFCLMSLVWLQAGPSERWIYDRWGQSCVYQNLIIPCNGEALCSMCKPVCIVYSFISIHVLTCTEETFSIHILRNFI